MIISLTPEQEAKLPFYCDKWLKIGLSTNPCDRAKAEDAMTRAYEVAGLSAPTEFRWFDGPLSMYLAIEKDKRSVGDSVWASIGGSAWASVRDSVWASVRDSVRDSVGASVRDSVGASGYGSHDAHWLGFYEFFKDECKLSVCNKLQSIIDLAHNCGWWVPFKNVVYVSEKPIRCEVENGKIHCDGNTAVEYNDGLKVYGWHGMRMPEEYGSIPSSEWKPEWIFKEENAERRRILTEQIGWERILEARDVELLDSWREYELYKCPSLSDDKDDNENNLPCVMLKMACPSTDRNYFLRVPPDIDDARSAATWINHNIDPERMRVNT